MVNPIYYVTLYVRVCAGAFKGFYEEYYRRMFQKQDMNDLEKLHRGFAWDVAMFVSHPFAAATKLVWDAFTLVLKIARAAFFLICFALCLAIGLLAPIVLLISCLWFAYQVDKKKLKDFAALVDEVNAL